METNLQPSQKPSGVIHEDPLPKDPRKVNFFDRRHIFTYVLFVFSMSVTAWAVYSTVKGPTNSGVSIHHNPETTTKFTYKNAEKKFQLTLPLIFRPYKVFWTQGSQGVGHPDYYQFSMPTLDKAECVPSGTDQACGYAKVFTITLNYFNETPPGQVLGKVNDTTYSISITPIIQLPDDLKNVDFKIPDVISSFQLTK